MALAAQPPDAAELVAVNAATKTTTTTTTSSTVVSSMIVEARKEQGQVSSTVKELAARYDLGAGGVNRYDFKSNSLQAHATSFAEAQELAALRAQLAAMDAALMERDAELAGLREKEATIQGALQRLKADNQSAGLWAERFEQAERTSHGHLKAIKDAHTHKETRLASIASLVQYVRALDDGSKIRDTHVNRLSASRKVRASDLVTSDAMRKVLSDRVVELEDGFVRCVGRITNSLASGLLSFSIGEYDPGTVCFAVLRVNDSQAQLTVYEEPDSFRERVMVAFDSLCKVTITANRSILLEQTSQRDVVQLGFNSHEELEKWLGALYLLDCIPAIALSGKPWPEPEHQPRRR
eukprot:TRINITY_DN36484_c0_g1_i1.p1 TRINITY_DN36484_c0_g1~~TRINITY_DN36484_c0_g1_i1.p1  ORF type:complete len:352 (+),score=71.48 TRINITY_DN36484_c0_g1_i1:60-1115(+)